MMRWQKDVAGYTTSYQEEFVSGLFPGALVGPAEIYLLLRDSATIYHEVAEEASQTTVHPSKLYIGRVRVLLRTQNTSESHKEWAISLWEARPT